MMRTKIISPTPTRLELDTSIAIVNVVLLLILFFLATGQLLNSTETEILPPTTTDLPFSQLPSPLLQITDDGQTWQYNGNPIDPTFLGTAIEQDDNGVSILHVMIDGDRPVHDLLELLERPELEGIEIRLVTLHQGARS